MKKFIFLNLTFKIISPALTVLVNKQFLSHEDYDWTVKLKKSVININFDRHF